MVSAVSRRFLVQISAQNLSQILNVCVKVCTKQTQKALICNETRFATKARILNKTLFATKARICRIAAWTCNNWHDPCNTIYAYFSELMSLASLPQGHIVHNIQARQVLFN